MFTHEITIGGVPYTVECDDDSPVTWLHKGETSYQISYAPDGLTGAVNTGLSCDCPTFRFRHAGTPSHGCKHITSISDEGLLPCRPERTEDESDGYDPSEYADDYRREESAELSRIVAGWNL